jgi:hypothetical protein
MWLPFMAGIEIFYVALPAQVFAHANSFAVFVIEFAVQKGHLRSCSSFSETESLMASAIRDIP